MERIATVKFIANKRGQTRGGLSAIIKYCSQDKKTFWNDRKLVTGINCVAQSSYIEMMNTKNQYRKTDGRMFYHLIQSFHPNENITPEIAHEIALRLAEETFKGYEVLVATHSDTEHIHSHFVVNSVSFETGKKYHPDNEEINRIRTYSDKLCLEYGLSVLEPKKKSQITQMPSREYRVADRGQSWKLQLAITIDEAMKYAVSKEHFISLMETEGYEVKWTDTRKSITYTTPNCMKCRDNKLHETKYLKENMEYEFINRKEIIRRIEKPIKDESAESREYTGVRIGDREQLEGSDKCCEQSDRDSREFIRGGAEQGTSDGLSQPDEVGKLQTDKRNEVDTAKLSDHNGADNEEQHRELETDSNGYYLTGWEVEREVFTGLLNDEREVSEADEEAYGHSLYSNSTTGSLVSDTACFIAGLRSIIDEPDKEEQTNMKKPKKERKNYERQQGMKM